MSVTSSPIDKAVILAAGMGTRMRCGGTSAKISDQQQSTAETGVKALIPFGRPFLDYLLGHLAEAGYRRICLVIGPGHTAVREYYDQLVCDRLSIEFALQQRPLGTADAVLAAESFAQQDEFLVINSDNLYPVDVLRRLRLGDGPGTAGFELQTVLDPAQRSVERLAAMAMMKPDDDGRLKEIVEKPDPSSLNTPRGQTLVSMNCWRFAPAIFDACRRIEPSQRGEYEIPSAVQLSIDHLRQRYRIFASGDCVLDLSHRDDIASVARALQDKEIRL